MKFTPDELLHGLVAALIRRGLLTSEEIENGAMLVRQVKEQEEAKLLKELEKNDPELISAVRYLKERMPHFILDKSSLEELKASLQREL